jgi:hypothetical protein
VLTHGLPMQQSGTFVVVEGTPAESVLAAGSLWAGPGFFDLLRIPLLYGRAIEERDRADTVAFRVWKRSREIGIRMALGAREAIVEAVIRRFVVALVMAVEAIGSMLDDVDQLATGSTQVSTRRMSPGSATVRIRLE